MSTIDSAEFMYKRTDYMYSEHECCLSWRDLTIGIHWLVNGERKLSAKDTSSNIFAEDDFFN